MSIYSGFGTRKQETVYNRVLYRVIEQLAARVDYEQKKWWVLYLLICFFICYYRKQYSHQNFVLHYTNNFRMNLEKSNITIKSIKKSNNADKETKTDINFHAYKSGDKNTGKQMSLMYYNLDYTHGR
jgi:hypothetical protein